LVFMTFLTPIWLLALFPWAGLVAWCLTRRGRTVAVPFVDLWPTDATPGPRGGARRPPLVVLLVLVGLLLAILAAGGPVVRRAGADGGAVTVLVDRGATMSIGDRLRPTVTDVLQRLADRAMTPRLVAVPASDATDPNAANGLLPTALDTATLLPAAIVAELRERPATPVLVITDGDLPAVYATDARVVRVAPTVAPPARIAIAHIAAEPVGSGGGGQVMVRLRSESATTGETTLTIESGADRLSRDVSVPPAGEVRDLFVDVPRLGEVVAVQVGAGLLGEQGFLCRAMPWPRVEVVGGAAPPDVARAVVAYGRARPASTGSRRVVVTVDSDDVAPLLRGDHSTVIVGAGDVTSTGDDPPTVTTDALTADIDWTALIGRGATVSGRPPVGFEPLVRVGDTTIMAATPVAESPRNVWVGLTAPSDRQSVAWVMMWTRLFDELGRSGAGRYEASLPRQLGNGWRAIAGDAPVGMEPGLWPGVYRHDDGRLVAVNPPDVTPRPGEPAVDWTDQVNGATATRSTPLSPPVLVAALACVTAAGWLAWRRSGALSGTSGQLGGG
jgi:hypothetical protein